MVAGSREPGLTRPVSLLVFDLDGVLCDFLPARRLAYLSELTGKDAAWMQAAVWESDFEREAEAGAYRTGDAYLQAFNRCLGFAVTREQWVSARRAAMRLRPDMLALLQSLHSQVRLAVLTNNGALVRDAMAELAPELWTLLGSQIHVTCDFNARKPDPAVYVRLAERYRLPPAAIVFIDDSAANVQGARAAGLQAVLFENAAQLSSLLAGVLDPPEGEPRGGSP